MALLIISHRLIPSTARMVVKLWPSMRENSVKVVLILGWYVVMASLIIGARAQIDEAWEGVLRRVGWKVDVGRRS